MSSSHHWPVDQQGYLLNVGNRSKLQPEFQPLIDEAVHACLKAIEGDLHSLYIIGSMARGEAQPGFSDFDFIAVLEYQVDPELVKQDWIAPTMRDLSTKYAHLVNGVEFDLWPQGYLFRDPSEFSPGAFLIATQSICVWGSDLVPELPRYHLNHVPTLNAIANEDLLYFNEDLLEIEDRLEASPSPDKAKELSRELGKKIARAGFALALERTRLYTRDVAQCAADFSQVFPNKSEAMQKALSLYQQPTDNIGDIQEVLTQFGSRIYEAAKDWLDEYNPDGEEFYFIGDEGDDEDVEE